MAKIELEPRIELVDATPERNSLDAAILAPSPSIAIVSYGEWWRVKLEWIDGKWTAVEGRTQNIPISYAFRVAEIVMANSGIIA